MQPIQPERAKREFEHRKIEKENQLKTHCSAQKSEEDERKCAHRDEKEGRKTEESLDSILYRKSF